MGQSPRNTRYERLTENLLVAAVYYSLGRLTGLLALTDVAALWFPIGFAVAVFLLRGYRVWPGIVAGALAMNLFTFLTMGFSPTSAAGLAFFLACGGTLAPLTAVWLLRRAQIPDIRRSAPSVLWFVVLAAFAGAAVSATIGTASTVLWGLTQWSAARGSWLAWWVGDAMGTLVATPVVLTLADIPWRNRPPRSILTGTAAALVLAIVTYAAFGPLTVGLPGSGRVLHYAVIVITMWLAFSYQWRGASAGVLLVVAIASWGTKNGYGPLSLVPGDAAVTPLGMYFATLSIAAWTIAGGVSAQRQSARQVGELSRLNQSVIENASIWMCVFDLQGNVVMWNKAAETISGYSRNEIVGHGRYWDWLYPDEETRRVVLDRLRSDFAGDDDVHDMETVIRCRDGTSRTMAWHGRRLKGERDEAVGSVVLAQDVTQQRQAENALRQSEANFKSLAENASDGILIAVPPAPGHFVYLNQRTADMLGWTVEEGLRSTLKDALHPDDYQMVVDRMASRISGKNTVNQYEVTIVRRDGTHVPVEINSAVTTWHDQPAVIATVRDITERKRAENVLRESEEHYRVLMETANDMAVLCTLDGRITYANKAAMEVVGRAHQEPPSANILDFIAPDQAEAVRSRLVERSRGDDRIQLYESVLITENGQRVPVEVSSSPVSWEGKPRQVLIMARDIRERKQMEAERDRLRSLLLDAQKMEAVGQLAGGIAHDFNNLLTGVNGYAELIQFHAKDDPEMRDMAARILASGERAAGLVRQLLAFASKQHTHPRPVDLNSVVRRCVDLWGVRTTANVKIVADLQPDLWHLLIDPAQADQLVEGLMGRASDAVTGNGHILLRTANASLSDDTPARHPEVPLGDYVLLEVSHSGSPLEENMRQRIFEPFFFTSDAVADGIGLRMAAVYGIVKQNRGHIVVDSPGDDGTRYQILLPRTPQVDASQTTGT